jgi:hypothetical protein
MTSIKKALRALLKSVAPASLFERIAAVRSRRHQVRWLREGGIFERVKRHIEEHGTVVLAGPFAGMVYPLDSATCRWVVPKLLGTYEDEIHPFLETLRSRKYDCIIDVGSAEGYYAVGLARMFQVPVHAYDPEPYEKNFSAMMAERNGVSELVRMDALFTVDDLHRFADQRVLMVCDCEGFEEVLFRPDTIDLVRNWDLFIELHGTADRALSSLPWPHAVTFVNAVPKSGGQNEFRATQQRYLLCDSRGIKSGVA